LFPKQDVEGLTGKVDNHLDALICDELVLKLFPGTADVPRFIPRERRKRGAFSLGNH
jgi:hypothetical protein